MSAFFPHVNVSALQALASAAAAAEHASRLNRNAPAGGKKPSKGKGKGRLQDKKLPTPQVTQCEDTVWAGEQMILITFDPQTVPLGPHCMLAHFPRGRPTFTTKALVGMTSVVREGAQIIAPKIYGYYDNVPNPVNAEVVLMEMLPGENLAEVWHALKPRQVMTVCMRLAELLVKLFNCRSPLLCSETNVPDSPPVPHSRFRRPVLLARPFDDGPLARADPQEALTSTHDYLLALSKRPERVFGTSAAAPTGAGARDPTWAGAPLSDADVDAIRSTWNRLGSLIPYHSGGFYIPGSLSPEARHTAYSVLQSKEYGVRHGDMALPRFLVRWARPGDDTSDATLALTGWEHAARAPLWACARLPPWLVPSPAPHEPLDWPAQRAVRTALFQSVFRADALPHAQGWEWVVAHVFGATERWFEGVLGAHWAFRDTAEVLLVRLRAHWLRERPDVPFPLDVGGAYLARVWARLPRAPREPVRPKGMFVFGAEDASVAVGVGAEAEGVVSKTRSFVEEVRAAMGVLAGGLEIPQEVSWPQVRVEHRDDDVD